MKTKLFLIAFLFLSHLVQSQPNKVKRINGREVDQANLSFTPRFNTDCDTIFSFATADDVPVGLAYDGTNFYSYGLVNHVIYKFNLDGLVTDSIPYPSMDISEGGGDMDFDGTFLWHVQEQEGRIYKLNPSNGDIITSFSLPTSSIGEADSWGCAYENGYIWTTEYGDKTLMRIDATTGALVDSFFINREILPLKIIHGELYGIEFLDITAGNFQLIKFDKSTGAAIDSIPWCLGFPLGLNCADDHLWGLSSGFNLGTSRVYKFESLLCSTKNEVPSNISVTVFPNPTSNQITVSSSGPIQLIELFAVTGEIVLTLQGKSQTIPCDIDLSGFQKGIYFMRIFDRFGYIVEKIVIQ